MRLIKRLTGEVVVLVASIAVAAGIALLVAPGAYPDADSERFVAEKQRFYDRLILAQLTALAAWIGAYYSLHKLYDGWRAGAPAASKGPDNPPLERTGREGFEIRVPGRAAGHSTAIRYAALPFDPRDDIGHSVRQHDCRCASSVPEGPAR